LRDVCDKKNGQSTRRQGESLSLLVRVNRNGRESVRRLLHIAHRIIYDTSCSRTISLSLKEPLFSSSSLEFLALGTTQGGRRVGREREFQSSNFCESIRTSNNRLSFSEECRKKKKKKEQSSCFVVVGTFW